MDLYYITNEGEFKQAKVVKKGDKMILEKDNGRIMVSHDDPIFLMRCWFSPSIPEAVAISQRKNILMEMIIHRMFFGDMKRLKKNALDELKQFIRKQILE